MLVQTGALSGFTNDFLRQKYDYVSADVDDGTIVQALDSGRDGRGGVTFTTGNDDNTFAYDLYIQGQIPAADTQTFGLALKQTITQHVQGGRLLTLVDNGEDVFGQTTQVGVNLMPNGTLQAVRANAAGTGIVLRGLDDISPQVTLLGQSETGIDAADTEFVEITVFHHAAVGSVNATFYDNTGAVKGTWALSNVNTAISGRDQSTSYCYGGYAYSDGSMRVHQDLQAVISDLHIVNNIVNPDDAHDPVGPIGNRKPIMVLPEAAGDLSEWSPSPAQPNYLNVNEVPPDSDTTENIAAEGELRDSMEMANAVASDGEVYLAYSGFVRAASLPECSDSDAPANFGAFIYTEQPAPGSVASVIISDDVCDFGVNGMGHRAQSVCTIAQDGESVTFTTPTITQTDRFYVFLTPLDAPPRLQVKNQNVPGLFGPCVFNSNQNVQLPPAGELRYALPWDQPWAGYGLDTQNELSTTGDFFEFKLSGTGTSIDVGLMPTDFNVALAPYTPSSAAFHFRQDLPGLPFFYIGTNFTYNGETTYSYTDTDRFRLTRTATAIQLRQNGILLETITPGVMPADLLPYALLGRWGWDGSSYTIRPGIREAVAATAGIACQVSNFLYQCTTPGVGPSGANTDMEVSQWGLVFEEFGGDGFAVVVDPIDSSGPFPQVQYDANTVFTFRLDSGNVLIEVTGYLFIEGFVESGGTGTYTYSRPYADTDDFFLQPPFDTVPVGVQPQFGGPDSFEYEFIPAVANAPLRLGFIVNLDDSVFPDRPQLNNVSFTFVPQANPTQFAGFIREGADNRDGTAATADTDYRYKQSILASTTTGEAITVEAANNAQHGYRDSE